MVIIIEASMCVSRARIVRAGFDTGTSVYRTFDLIETTSPLAKLRWQNIGRVWLLQVLTATVAELGPPLHTARDPSTCANWLHIVTCKFDAFQYCKLSLRKVILARKVKIQYNNYNGCKLKVKI